MSAVDQILSLQDERAVYRLMAHAALGHLHDAQQREAKLAEQLQALRDELRRYTAAQMPASM